MLDRLCSFMTLSIQMVETPHTITQETRLFLETLPPRVIALRKRNLSVYDIRDELERGGKDRLIVTAIQEVLREEGFSRLPRRLDQERPNRPRPMADVVADMRRVSLPDGEVS